MLGPISQETTSKLVSWFLASLMVGVSIFFISVIWKMSSATYYMTHPKFPVGTCLGRAADERWESSTIAKILETGKANYLVVYWNTESKKWGTLGFTVPYVLAHGYMEKIECPNNI